MAGQDGAPAGIRTRILPCAIGRLCPLSYGGFVPCDGTGERWTLLRISPVPGITSLRFRARMAVG
jgi:hypothetical protein